MKPLIGITPLVDTGRESLWMLPGYMDGIAEAGGMPVMLPLTHDSADLAHLTTMCDGLLFTGGHDVSPYLYSATPSAECGECSDERDRMELLLLREAIRQDKAVMGICRGIQFINAALGGTLYQDLPTEHPSDVEHHMTAPYDRHVHNVSILPSTPLHSLLGITTLGVNSYHHQAIRTLATDLTAMATSTDGLVEAVYHNTMRYLRAYQWHPEFSYKTDEASRKIFADFVQNSGSR